MQTEQLQQEELENQGGTSDQQQSLETPTKGRKRKTPVFDEFQQQHINRSFDRRFAEINTHFEKEIEIRDQELEGLRTKLTQYEGDGEDSPDNLKSKIKSAQERASAAEQRELNLRKEVAMSRAISSCNFICPPEDVVALTHDSVKWSNGKERLVVVDPASGKERLNASLNPMTLDEFFTDFAQRRPHLVSGDIVGGAGSSDSKTGDVNVGVVRTKADIKDRKAKIAYITKFGLAAYEHLPLR